MYKITIKMEVDDKIKADNWQRCQASFNSDGKIVLRNYNTYDKNNDEILILSSNETEAIIRLFKEIAKIVPDSLPF